MERGTGAGQVDRGRSEQERDEGGEASQSRKASKLEYTGLCMLVSTFPTNNPVLQREEEEEEARSSFSVFAALHVPLCAALTGVGATQQEQV